MKRKDIQPRLTAITKAYAKEFAIWRTIMTDNGWRNPSDSPDFPFRMYMPSESDRVSLCTLYNHVDGEVTHTIADSGTIQSEFREEALVNIHKIIPFLEDWLAEWQSHEPRKVLWTERQVFNE